MKMTDNYYNLHENDYIHVKMTENDWVALEND